MVQKKNRRSDYGWPKVKSLLARRAGIYPLILVGFPKRRRAAGSGGLSSQNGEGCPFRPLFPWDAAKARGRWPARRAFEHVRHRSQTQLQFVFRDGASRAML